MHADTMFFVFYKKILDKYFVICYIICQVMQNGGRPYVKAPFQTYKNVSAEIQFRQIIDLPDEVRGQVDTAILSEFYRIKEQWGGET